MKFSASLARPGTILLGPGFLGTPVIFTEPVHTVTCTNARALSRTLQAIDHWQQDGFYCAGFLAYEAGGPLVGVPTRPSRFPLLWFGAYRAPQPYLPTAAGPDLDRGARAEQFSTEIDVARYRDGFSRIIGHIQRGDTYQVNYTFRCRFPLPTPGITLFADCVKHHPVPYAAYLHTGAFEIISLSPELFLTRHGRHITARPMKGSARRGHSSDEDAAQANWLKHSEKNRAENLMIVDLLRNDLGKVAAWDSVTVPELFRIEKYATLFQMTSTVRATLREHATWPAIIAATFPSGSITGAPKKRTMEIIHDVETSPRNIYTGSIGVIRPGGDFTFNIAIRTILRDCEHGQAELGIGGGIVSDSVADDEWQEALLKRDFLFHRPPPFSLIETMRFEPATGITLLARHLDRLRASAAYFTIPCDRDEIKSLIMRCLSAATGPHLVRLTVSQAGQPRVVLRTLPPAPATSTVAIAPERTSSDDRWRRHKTTNRRLYDRYRQQAATAGLFEYIFLNEHSHVTEGTITNVFIKKDGQLSTPPLTDGVLPGVMRAAIIEQQQAIEKSISPDDLLHADALFLTNAVRGIIKTDLRQV